MVGLNHGRGHVEYALSSGRVELAAVCDNNAETLERVAAAAPAARRFTDYGKLLDWGGFDAAIIAVPPFLHKEFGVAAIKAGKHVFIEKPLTDNLAESRELRNAFGNAETIFQVGYCVRSSPLIRRLLSIIGSGRLGEVVLVWFNMSVKCKDREQEWRNSREHRGGKLFDCMPHYFDIIGLLAGVPFERLTAFGNVQGATGANADRIPTVASVMLEYSNGVKGTHLLSETTPTIGNGSFFGVAGTCGIVYGNPWDPQGAGSLECQLEDGLFTETIQINGELASRGHLGFSEQHEAFVDAIVNGGANPCTLEDGYQVDVLMEAIDRSLATGKTISRGEILDSNNV